VSARAAELSASAEVGTTTTTAHATTTHVATTTTHAATTTVATTTHATTTTVATTTAATQRECGRRRHRPGECESRCKNNHCLIQHDKAPSRMPLCIRYSFPHPPTPTHDPCRAEDAYVRRR
jgi:hypothetical protein